MNDIERQELRDFLAREVMGWKIDSICAGILNKPNGNSMFRWNFCPDSPDAPASQLLGVIEAMGERGWKVVMGNNLDRSYFADFRALSYPVPMNNFYVEVDTLPEAVCLAARAALTSQQT